MKRIKKSNHKLRLETKKIKRKTSISLSLNYASWASIALTMNMKTKPPDSEIRAFADSTK